MKRWFICRRGNYEGDGTVVPKVALYQRNGALITDPATQVSLNFRIWTKPAFAWCFGQLAVQNVAELQADPDVYILPDGSMDMSVGAIPANVRTTMRNRLESVGFTFNDVKTTWTVRQLLNYLLQQIQPLPSVEAGDIRDE